MKNLLILLLFLVVGTTDILPQQLGDQYALDINSIYLPLNRKGVLADVNYYSGGPGGQFGGEVFLFSGGFFLSGYSDGQLWANAVASASLVEDYIQGTFGDPNNFSARLYRLNSDDPPFISESWQDWQYAVALGADFYDGNGDGFYTPVDLNGNGQWDPGEDRPDILGDETIWCVFHDGASQRRWVTVEPQGIEIRQTVFAYSTVPELQNIIFIRYRIRNTGIVTNEMTDVYFGVWDDPDIGGTDGSTDDLVGCDTVLQGGYTYNDGPDPSYGNNPPSFFAKTLAGPVTYIPGVTFIDNNGNGQYDEGIDTPLDTAYVHRGQVLGIEEYPGAMNLALSSAVHYLNGDPLINDPDNKEEARNYMLGLRRDGYIIDPCTWSYGVVSGGVNCSEVNPMFWYSGDPVTNYGWINTTPTDQRQMQNIGPFTLQAGKEIEVIIAYTVGQGTDALASITEVKNIANISQELFVCNFEPSCIVSVDEQLTGNQPEDYTLFQNYPNPFNPSTTIKFSLPSSNYTTLKIFNTLGEVVTVLIDQELITGVYEVEWNATALPSGIYFYQLKTEGYFETKKMMLLK